MERSNVIIFTVDDGGDDMPSFDLLGGQPGREGRQTGWLVPPLESAGPKGAQAPTGIRVKIGRTGTGLQF